VKGGSVRIDYSCEDRQKVGELIEATLVSLNGS
jgi:hypothetical protein